MLFNSLEFAVFFAIVGTLYYVLPNAVRWPFLLAASAMFYMFWEPIYILYLAFLIITDYFIGRKIAHTECHTTRKKLLLVSIFINIGMLFYFKYFNFFSENLNNLLNVIGQPALVPFTDVVLPLGISFHVFQSLSYIIDVYRGEIKAEKNFIRYALFVLFFPQLVAGPIERATHLLGQFGKRYPFDYEKVTFGLKLITWGLFKKMVVADNAAIVVNQVYSNPHDYQGMALIIATLFFAFQIYGDFSGYSDIARGAALCLGISIVQNFQQPYHASSLAAFWRRWHVSLMTWFRDYVYIPLGGRSGGIKKYVNITTVFVVSGLWHGAQWHFIIWGMYHAMLYAIISGLQLFARKIRLSLFLKNLVGEPILLYAGIAFTFTIVTFGWIFFRAASLRDAYYITTNLLNRGGLELHIPLLTVAFIVILFIAESLGGQEGFLKRLSVQHTLIRWPVYLLMGIAVTLLGISNQEFIYFQF